MPAAARATEAPTKTTPPFAIIDGSPAGATDQFSALTAQLDARQIKYTVFPMIHTKIVRITGSGIEVMYAKTSGRFLAHYDLGVMFGENKPVRQRRRNAR